ncbi:sulfite reductase subunit beta [Arachidicoccus ginsenosidimutans]|uniref:NADPH-dependent assimilatory sulfite reductase hemoprotein subunit n=1 Tax=Arachidicoccus sp. BS20 TaxID=1850526 RepID=UPI0007F0DE2D|nr:NADPH-dependent assimilatory sulfite reductase hemoprotein subunit [Arachidicoccus sp. BS20]ANI89485.1 sulfite reductase subunit beta [Arachidicoccus sp. BS20]
MSNESPLEKIKKNSKGLRGTLVESLNDEYTGAIREDDQALVKFHGMYLQDDRDRREQRAEKKLDRLWSFMLRLRLPGGFLTAEQWESLHHIAGKYSTGIIKITTRQTVQLHGILKQNTKPTHKEFNLMKLDSIAACGDVNRNVLATAHPKASPVHQEVFEAADKLSALLKPKTRAYYEIFVGEEKISEKVEEDPLYHDSYLPRKFKIALAIPPYNDVDVFTNDVALIAIVKNKKLIGYNVAAGGGMGTTHGNSATYPRLASMLGYIDKKDLDKVVYEIATTQRDFGNREDRKLSRLKYTVDRLGLNVFKAEVEKRTGITFQPAKPYKFTHRIDDFGWAKNHENKWYYTAFVETGRVYDGDNVSFKQAFLEIAEARKANFRFTANQNIIISDVEGKDKAWVDEILTKYGVVKATENASLIRKESIACVALNTCPLALAEGQRYLPSLIDKVDTLINKHQLNNQNISIRMTGCPNGCARPYAAEIGFVGTASGHYNLMLGADSIGERLNKIYKESLDEESILSELDNLLGSYASQKNAQESFGDFVVRKGIVN